MPASRLESAILHVMHDAPVAASRLESAILHVMHGAPAQASRLESAILHVMHDATPAPSGAQRLLGQSEREHPGLLGSFAQRSRLQS